MQPPCISNECKKHVRMHMLWRTSYNPQPQHKLCQAVLFFFTFYCHKHSFALTPLHLLYVCQIYTAGSRWSLTVPAASTAHILASLPLLLSCLGVSCRNAGRRAKALVCLLPWPGSLFVLDNASDERHRECQSVSRCLCLHKHLQTRYKPNGR